MSTTAPTFRLSGVRALAALSVLVFHAGLYTRAQEGSGWGPELLAQLNLGVALFFLVSGFLLYRPWVAARAGGGAAPRLAGYVRRRLARIVPAYWVALTVLAVFPGLPDLPSRRAWLYYGFLQDYSHRRVNNGIGPAWTLGCEMAFYVLLPAIAFGVAAFTRRRGGRQFSCRVELGVVLILIVGSIVYRLVFAAGTTVRPPVTFLATIAPFALGMGLAALTVEAQRHPGQWGSTVRRHSWLGWPLAAVLYLLLSLGLGLTGRLGFTTPRTCGQQLVIYALQSMIAVALMLPVVFAPARAGRIQRLLECRPLSRLGEISYGIYLYHVPVLVALNGTQYTGSDRGLRLLWVIPATLVISCLCAAASHRLIERPAMAWARRSAPLRLPRPVVLRPEPEPGGAHRPARQRHQISVVPGSSS